MLYSKIAAPALALVAATSVAAAATRRTPSTLLSRQESDDSLPEACTEVCAPLDVLGTLDCEMTAPGCEHCSILQGILNEIRDCYVCQLQNDAPTTPAEIQESMDAIAAQCAETQDVVFEAPDIIGAFPGTGESESDDGQEPTSSGPTNGNSPEPTGESPADDDNQDSENPDDQGAAVRGVVSVGTLGLGVILTSLLL